HRSFLRVGGNSIITPIKHYANLSLASRAPHAAQTIRDPRNRHPVCRRIVLQYTSPPTDSAVLRAWNGISSNPIRWLAEALDPRLPHETSCRHLRQQSRALSVALSPLSGLRQAYARQRCRSLHGRVRFWGQAL